MTNPRTSIQLDQYDQVARLRLVPPDDKPPTLDHGVLAALDESITTLEERPPMLLVIESASSRHFCVGANLHALKDLDERTIVAWIRHGHQVFDRLEDLPCATIARVRGYALGGGLELALRCDQIYASHGARFGLPEGRLGLVPGWGGCLRLPQRIGISHAKRHFFSGGFMDAVTAECLGLADFLGDDHELDAEIERYAKELRTRSVRAIASFKRIVDESFLTERGRNRAAELEHSQACLSDPEARQRIEQFLAGRG